MRQIILTDGEWLAAVISTGAVVLTSIARFCVAVAALRSSWRNARAIQDVHDCLDEVHNAVVPKVGNDAR